MIHFSTQGTYLLLVPQGRTLLWVMALICFLRNNRIFKTKLQQYQFIKKGTITETVTVTNIQWMFSQREGTLSIYMSIALTVYVPASFMARMNTQAIPTIFEEEIIRLKELCTHMDIIVEKLRWSPLFFNAALPYVCELN